MTAEISKSAFLSQNGPVTRHELSYLLRWHCRKAGIANYLIVEIAPGGTPDAIRILSSDWTFDVIEDLGIAAIARLADCYLATEPGTCPHGWRPSALAGLLGCEEIAGLEYHGQQEVSVLALPVGKRRFAAIVSTHAAGQTSQEALGRMQIAFCHLLSGFKTDSPAEPDLLSERERECLRWVSEGKTADEISLILDVSTNTVNSYVAQAAHRLSARNRAMAIATAVRQGLI